MTWALASSEKSPDGAVVANRFAGWTARAQLRDRLGGTVWLALTTGTGLTLTAASDNLTVHGTIAHTLTQDAAWNDRTNGLWDGELVR